MMWLVVWEMFLAYFRIAAIICELHNLQALFQNLLCWVVSSDQEHIWDISSMSDCFEASGRLHINSLD